MSSTTPLDILTQYYILPFETGVFSKPILTRLEEDFSKQKLTNLIKKNIEKKFNPEKIKQFVEIIQSPLMQKIENIQLHTFLNIPEINYFSHTHHPNAPKIVRLFLDRLMQDLYQKYISKDEVEQILEQAMKEDKAIAEKVWKEITVDGLFIELYGKDTPHVIHCAAMHKFLTIEEIQQYFENATKLVECNKVISKKTEPYVKKSLELQLVLLQEMSQFITEKLQTTNSTDDKDILSCIGGFCALHKIPFPD